jgi:L-amino acid N-acyltransferase YncA
MARACLRPATEADAEALAAIYRAYVLETPISFEVEPPSAAEMAQRIEKSLSRWAWLVHEAADGRVVSYAYVSAYAERSSYRWSVLTSVYALPERHRRGDGRALYTALLSLLQLQGFEQAMAGITLPNAGSVGLHEAMGFEPVGVYRRAGFKLGRWHDVAYFQRALQAHGGADPTQPVPAETRTLQAVLATREGQAALAAGQALLRD